MSVVGFIMFYNITKDSMRQKAATRNESRSLRSELMTPLEVAEALRVDERTLANWRYRGQGPVFLRVGGLIRYAQSDLENFLRESRQFMTGHFVKE